MELTDYYGLVFHLAKQMHQRLRKVGADFELDDLVQEGMVGLVQAAQNFDPQVGAKFTTFAYPRISGAIKDALRRRDTLSQEQREKVRELEQTRERVLQAKGREPLGSELAAAIAVSPTELGRLEALHEARHSTGSLGSRQGLVMDPEQETRVVWQQLGADVRRCLEVALDEREQQVLLLRFWMAMTLEQVGTMLGMELQQVYRTEIRARGKLRDCLAGKDWEVDAVRETLSMSEPRRP